MIVNKWKKYILLFYDLQYYIIRLLSVNFFFKNWYYYKQEYVKYPGVLGTENKADFFQTGTKQCYIIQEHTRVALLILLLTSCLAVIT